MSDDMVRLGDVLRRKNGSHAHWLINRVSRTGGFMAVCVKAGTDYSVGQRGMSWGSKIRPEVERVPEDEIPEEVWPRIAMLRMGFAEGDE